MSVEAIFVQLLIELFIEMLDMQCTLDLRDEERHHQDELLHVRLAYERALTDEHERHQRTREWIFRRYRHGQTSGQTEGGA